MAAPRDCDMFRYPARTWSPLHGRNQLAYPVDLFGVLVRCSGQGAV